ncbi:MAG: hypothetical protein A2015_07415 [Spirochaetes bacterium GWF1_31_7]|nr:MAG: hypothetical protein A2Y30_02790 [Spirochaetes bacterium GWE1_32_154]OHD47585.1 MAG: hypothetical protein A2Y29_00235 [Spirochaetes bacterium GWE2_31_10]OHD51246.1 MAG: hypothetical protein A2015_07415 [Spirochaetes bacterium GWF1_31_7]OHD81239.1 MAG: hypothetical protein A2355_03470 [Spirochaetes bacterium RIFOXYB1_FULL_32_8]HBD96142.1 transcriptional regulator [Spirochaetia bacterium]
MYSNETIKEVTRTDFDKAFQKALFSRILSRIKGQNNTLLSFHEVMKYVKVKNEAYRGLQCVKINEIVGSEGRYNDFNKEFLPKRRNLRQRWERVDEAHYQEKILPPIKLYKLGGVYFVRDGNHRVSVSKEQRREFIDAEVIEIKTDIVIQPDMTREDLLQIVIEHENKAFLEITRLDELRDVSDLHFSFPGRFDDILSHIHGHQYYLGIDSGKQITFNEAMLSWYDNLFMPIINEIKSENLLTRFPGRTESDLYVWIIRHWDDLKKKYGEDIQIKDAVKSYNKKFGQNPVVLAFQKIKSIFIRG